MSNGPLYGFLEQVVDLVKKNTEFRKRLGLYHDADNFADPANPTEAESIPFIWGEDAAYVHSLASADHAVREDAISLMPFAEIRLESFTVSRPGGNCGENFNQLENAWVVTMLDEARSAGDADTTSDPLASTKDAFLWASKMLKEFETLNANEDYHFDSIDLSTIKRTAPSKRGQVCDFWFAEFTFAIETGD